MYNALRGLSWKRWIPLKYNSRTGDCLLSTIVVLAGLREDIQPQIVIIIIINKNGDYSWSVSSDSWGIYSKFHLEGFTFQHCAFWSAFLQTTKSIRCIFTIVALVRFFACVIFQMSPQSGGMGCLVVWAIGHELSLFKNWISLLWYLEKVTPQIMIA